MIALLQKAHDNKGYPEWCGNLDGSSFSSLVGMWTTWPLASAEMRCQKYSNMLTVQLMECIYTTNYLLLFFVSISGFFKQCCYDSIWEARLHNFHNDGANIYCFNHDIFGDCISLTSFQLMDSTILVWLMEFICPQVSTIVLMLLRCRNVIVCWRFFHWNTQRGLVNWEVEL
jgi:hypothetical protein